MFTLHRLALAPLAVVGALLFAPEIAHAEDFITYYGAHPVPASHGGGWCNDNAKHFHAFSPDDYYMYSEYDGNLYFIGDPSDFAYSGTLYHYWDHHRIDVRMPSGVVTIGYCYIPGPHTHGYAPGYENYYHQFYYNSAYYYYWYDDLWSYPGYSRYYDTYYDYWYVSFPTYYPGCAPHRDVDVSWGSDVVQRPHNNYGGYSGKGSNPRKGNTGYPAGSAGRGTGSNSSGSSGGYSAGKGSSGNSTSTGKGSSGNSTNGYSGRGNTTADDGSVANPPSEGYGKPKSIFGRGGSSSDSAGSAGSYSSGGKGIFTGKGSSANGSSSGSKTPAAGSSSGGKGSSANGSSSGGKGSSGTKTKSEKSDKSGGYSTGKKK